MSFVFFLNISAFAQDIIKTSKGKELKCNITRINSDTIFFVLDYKGQISNTFVPISAVKSFQLHVIKELAASIDTSEFYTIRMEDGSSLQGKILFYDEKTVLLKDNNLGEIKINAENIKTFDKHNKNAYIKIELNDGNILNGRIVERKANELIFKTDNLGQLNIPTNSIKKITEIKQENVKNGQYWFPNPNSSRYLFGPSGLSLKKGEGYYQNIYVAYNSVSYGLTDNITIGGGVILPVMAFITPKISFKVAPDFYMGAGAILGIAPGNEIVGITYGIASYGTIEHNITGGVGYGFYFEEFQNRPVITLSAMTRVSRRISLVTENWAIPTTAYDYSYNNRRERKEYYVLFSYGIRLMSEKRFSFDFAFINSKDIVESFFIGIPYIDFVLTF